MHYTLVKINRDEMTAPVVHVGAWEIPILQAKHGEEKIEVGELTEFKSRPWPENAGSEMQRLATLYGMRGAGDSAVSFVEFVYGVGSVGVKALAKAIAEAKAAAAPKGKKGAAADLVGATG